MQKIKLRNTCVLNIIHLHLQRINLKFNIMKIQFKEDRRFKPFDLIITFESKMDVIDFTEANKDYLSIKVLNRLKRNS